MYEFAQKRVGEVLHQKYRLEQLLGVGGMAAVYRGTHRNGNRVAVKMLHPHLALVANIRERFLREGYVANKVDHRGAVRVLDDDVLEDGSAFLVMELLEGESLQTRWERAGKKLPPREVAELAHQLLDVLGAAHSRGIVHRDIKPDNVFLTKDGVLKVLDFGIARLHEPDAQSHTRTGSTLGTPAYMPPEQALGRTREIDGQTDVWAVGATMFTLTSGLYVHEAESVDEMRVYAGSRPARSLASVAPHVPAPLIAVVDRALAFDRAARWPSAHAMASALEGAYAAAFGVALPSLRGSGAPAAAFAETVAPAAPPVIASAHSAPPVKSDVSTTAGVATPRATPAPPPAKPSHAGAIAFTTAGMVAVAAVGIFGFRHVRETRSMSTSPPQSAPPPAVEIVAVDAAPAHADDALPALAPIADAAAAPAPLAKDAGAGHAGHTGRRDAAAAQPPPPLQTKPQKNCDPPYTLDSNGHRVPKTECME